MHASWYPPVNFHPSLPLVSPDSYSAILHRIVSHSMWNSQFSFQFPHHLFRPFRRSPSYVGIFHADLVQEFSGSISIYCYKISFLIPAKRGKKHASIRRVYLTCTYAYTVMERMQPHPLHPIRTHKSIYLYLYSICSGKVSGIMELKKKIFLLLHKSFIPIPFDIVGNGNRVPLPLKKDMIWMRLTSFFATAATTAEVNMSKVDYSDAIATENWRCFISFVYYEWMKREAKDIMELIWFLLLGALFAMPLSGILVTGSQLPMRTPISMHIEYTLKTGMIIK